MRSVFGRFLLAMVSVTTFMPCASHGESDAGDVVSLSQEELKEIAAKGVHLVSWVRANANADVGDATLATWLAADGPLDKDLLQHRMQNWVLSLHVTGTPSFEDRISEEGTGFLLHTEQVEKTVAMTALHVLRSDDAFISEGGVPQRQIAFDYHGPRGLQPVVAQNRTIRRMQAADAAIFYTDGTEHDGMRLSVRSLTPKEPLLVLAWPVEGPKAVEATFDKYETNDGKRLMRILGSFIESESGSPVVGHDGLVVGVLTERNLGPKSSTYGLAVPVSELGDLRGIAHLGRSEADASACQTEINNVLLESARLAVRKQMTCPTDVSKNFYLEVPSGYRAPGNAYFVIGVPGQVLFGVSIPSENREGHVVFSAPLNCDALDIGLRDPNSKKQAADPIDVALEVFIQKPMLESEKRLIGRFCLASGAGQ